MDVSDWKIPVIQDRIQKANNLRAMGVNLYPTGYKKDISIKDTFDKYGSLSEEELNSLNNTFSLAGRIVSKRDFGKACFAHIKDETGRIQIY
ncbi:MAG: OB-fold nucleic acid binding domain-containing protein, partial [Desulfatiglandales bacterium]